MTLEKKPKKKLINFSRSTIYFLISVVFVMGFMPLYYKFLEYQLWL